MSEAGRIYDSFPEGQTMSRAEFIKRFNAATDQKSMRGDLDQILAGKRKKRIIDRAVKGQN